MEIAYDKKCNRIIYHLSETWPEPIAEMRAWVKASDWKPGGDIVCAITDPLVRIPDYNYAVELTKFHKDIGVRRIANRVRDPLLADAAEQFAKVQRLLGIESRIFTESLQEMIDWVNS